MDAKLIAAALGRSRPAANGEWLASCPVLDHGQGNGDRNPSLSVTDADGKLLLKCHGGCSQHDVWAAVRDLGLLPQLSEWVEPLVIRPINGHHPAPVQVPRPVQYPPTPVQLHLTQEWEYVDESGIVLFVKQRFKTSDTKGKTYKLLRVMSDGSRQASMQGARVIPYRLSDVLEAKLQAKPVFICEGEKAADALASIGVFCSTSHTGAGSWPAANSHWFADMNIVLVPDNDAPGYRYASLVASALLPIAKSIRLLALPVGHTEDAFEWVMAGGDKAQLMTLCKGLQPVLDAESIAYLPPPAEDAEPAIELSIDAEEFTPEPAIELVPAESKIRIEPWDTIQDEPVEWLIQDILPRKGFSALFGPPGSFKSFIALDIAHSVATGSAWMGKEVSVPGAVLYICGEGHGGVGARIRACRLHHRTAPGAKVYVIRHQLNLRSSKEDIQQLHLAITNLVQREEIRFELVIVDTLARAFGGGNENDSSDMGAFIASLSKIQRLLDCALMIVHHVGKDITKGLRGHSSLLGALDTELELQRLDAALQDNQYAGSGNITITKQKDGSDGAKYGFRMVKVNLDNGRLGFDNTQSLAVEAADIVVNVQQVGLNRTGQGKHQGKAMSSFVESLRETDRIQSTKFGSKRVALVSLWREKVWRGLGKTGEIKSQDSDFRSIWRAATGLEGVTLDGDFAFFSTKTAEKEHF
jgi:AAA domain